MINDIEYPSVTTILKQLNKPALIGWAVKMCAEWIQTKADKDPNGMYILNDEDVEKMTKEYKAVSEEAMDIGSEVHNHIESYVKAKLRGESYDVKGEKRDEVQNGFLAFLGWEKEYVESWIESEVKVDYEKESQYCYCGIVDGVAKFKDGRTMLIDFKVSKGIYPEYITQLSAYRNAYEQYSGKPIDDMGILRLDKLTGEPEWKEYDEDKYIAEINSFLKLVDYYYSKPRRLKNNPYVVRK
jgi:hypothetical protein